MRPLLIALMAWLAVSLPGFAGAGTPGEGTVPFAKNQYFAKGGSGPIGDGIYVAVKSPQNEITIGPSRGAAAAATIWTGEAATAPQVVVVYERAVLKLDELPQEFDLTKATVVSFEAEVIRFFDFAKMKGGYYKRLVAKPTDTSGQ